MATRTNGLAARFKERLKLPPIDGPSPLRFETLLEPPLTSTPITLPATATPAPPPTLPPTPSPAAPADSAREPDPVPTFDQVMERLVRRFGWGGKRAARETLYRTLAKLVQTHGTNAMDAIAEAAAQAAGANRPDRYFCSAVTRKLAERGIRSNGSSADGGEDFFGRKREVV